LAEAALPAWERPGRLLHLDALRAFCMFFGVAVHGATIDYRPDPLFDGVRLVSDHFRMACFFVISGYFTGFVCQRMAVLPYLRNRALLLVLPLVSALLLVNPLANWLIHIWHNPPVSLTEYLLGGVWRQRGYGNSVWHLQMWFLFALIFYALLTPAALRLMRTGAGQGLMRAISRPVPPVSAWLVALAMGVAILSCRVLHDTFLYQLFTGTRLAWIFNATMNYLPWFLLGLFAFVDRHLFGLLHRFSPLTLLVAGLAYAAIGLWGADLPRGPERIAYWLARTAFSYFLVTALFGLFAQLVTRPSRALSFAVDSAFSFYIFHFLVIYLVANLLGDLVTDLHLLYLVILLLVPPITLAIHGLVIARVPLLRLMFNGKPPSHPISRPAARPAKS
jgi:glucan biosynthesis protein C